jgi:CRP/FNR family transcriptional regulator, cyclic AMP receptor protein
MKSGGPSHLKKILMTPGPGRTIEQVLKDETLFSQGKRGNDVFYILSGVVGLSVKSDGKEKIISLLGHGRFAGKECLAALHPSSAASGTALTECTVLKIQRKEMLRLLKSHDVFAELFVDYLLVRITEYQEVIIEHLFDSAEKRLARILLLLTNFDEEGSSADVVPNIGQEIFAEVVGTTRSRVSFFLNRFRVRGLIGYVGTGPIQIHTDELSAWLGSTV